MQYSQTLSFPGRSLIGNNNYVYSVIDGQIKLIWDAEHYDIGPSNVLTNYRFSTEPQIVSH